MPYSNNKQCLKSKFKSSNDISQNISKYINMYSMVHNIIFLYRGNRQLCKTIWMLIQFSNYTVLQNFKH